MFGRVYNMHCNILNVFKRRASIMALEKILKVFIPMISPWELKTTKV